MKRHLIVIIVLMLLLTGCNFINKVIEEKIDYIDKISIKIGDEMPTITSYVKNYDDLKDISDIVWKEIQLEDNKVYYSGIYTGEFKYKDESITISLEVIDDIKPEIENVKDITITEGDKVDLLKDVKTTDNSKEEVDLKVVGDYNTNKVGTYNLNVVATDKSNNENSVPFKLTVKEKPKVEVKVNPTPTPTPQPDVDLSGTSTKGYAISRVNGNYYVKGILIANKTYALSSSYNPGGLTKEFMDAFNKMKADASNEGISLWISSGYRSYSFQSTLYSQYAATYGKASADTFSARAGHSEHQSGLAADFNIIDQSFGNTKEGIWLSNNCHKYGFILRYPKGKESITGYIYEPWHFRYIGSEAENLYNNGNWITLEEYLGIDSKYSY